MTREYSIEGKMSMEQQLITDILYQAIRINQTTDKIVSFDYTGIGGGTILVKIFANDKAIIDGVEYDTLDKYGLISLTDHDKQSVLNEILDHLLWIGKTKEQVVFQDDDELTDFLEEVGDIGYPIMLNSEH